MATGQVLFHRFYCKKSFARFNVKRVAASCVWLASKLEESPRKARQVLIVFHRMECRRENLPIEHLDTSSKKYIDLKADLIRTERHLLKEMGFICHVEHPHKFISNYLAPFEAPAELRQEAWNLANDSLRTTLCVRFKSEVVACGVVYAAARRFEVPLPEDPPWWKAFDADKAGIDEVCRVLAHLYSLPKAQYIPVCKEGSSFATSNRSRDMPSLPVSKEGFLDVRPVNEDTEEVAKDAVTKPALDKLKDLKKNDDDAKPLEGVSKEDTGRTDHRTDAGGEKNKERERDRGRDRERERDKERLKSRERDRGRESDRERERDDFERDKEKSKERSHRSRDKGHSEKPKHHSSRDRDYPSYSSREKDRRRHH
ncbi:cyclin-L1-1 isoform X2 [Capsicum annuum]|nr:cyclin-L1-1 isoform X2 [Capsicum annuum]